MNKFIFILLFFATVLFAQDKRPVDTFQIGKASSSANKAFIFNTNDGVANPKLSVEQASKLMFYDKNAFRVGDGAPGTKEYRFDTTNSPDASLKVDFTTENLEYNKNSFAIGDGTDTDKFMLFLIGGNNPGFKYDSASSKILVSNDGTTFKGLGGGGGASGVNLLSDSNFDFETGDPPNSWTASAGTFIAAVGSGFDLQAGSWDAAAGADTLDSALIAVPDGLEGRDCNATIQFNYLSGSGGDYKFQVLDSGASVLAEKDLSITTKWTKDLLMFTCPSSDSVRIRILATANGDIILLDNASLGKTDFVDISQTELVFAGHFEKVADCAWFRTGTSFADFPVDVDCPAISVGFSSQAVDATDTDLPQVLFTNMRPGVYVATVMHSQSNGAGESAVYRIEVNGDATILDRPVWGHQTVSGDNVTGAGSITFRVNTSGQIILKMQGRATSGSVVINNKDNTPTLAFRVVKYPETSAEAITLETIGEHWDVNIGGGSPDLGNATISAYVETTDSGLDMVINNNSKSAQIPCSSTNASTGLTCSSGDESAGIVIDVSSAGRYKICFEFSSLIQINADASITTMRNTFQVIETPNNAQTLLQLGNTRVTYGSKQIQTAGSALGEFKTHIVCGQFVFASTGQKTLRLMREALVGGTGANVTLNQLHMDRNGALGQHDMHIIVDKMDQSFPTPAFTDLTNSLNNKLNVFGGEEYNVGAVTLNSSFSVVLEMGNWISSVDDDGTGDLTINVIAGFSSVNLICFCTTFATASNVCANDSATSTSAGFVIATTSAQAPIDKSIHIKCYGKK